MLKRLLLIGLVVVVVAAGGFWWFFLRDDAPERATLRDRSDETTTTAAGATADGTWTVQPGDTVFVGYRVDELFAGETIEKTAVGRTPAVEGTLTVSGQQITDATITADVTQMRSDQTRRDNAIRTRGLETDRFPEASFRLTEPIELAAPPEVGAAVTTEARGELTLRGVTAPATARIEARWNGDTIDVAGSAPVVFADFQIEPPSIGGFVSVEDRGELEFSLTYVRAST